MPNKFILDACALIALISDETGADVVNGLINKASNKEIDLFMSKINLLEVYYGVFRDLGIETAETVFAETVSAPIQIIDSMNDNVFREAGRLKASYKVSFADSIVLAYASAFEYSLVTADHHEFDIIEKSEKIDFTWIR